MDFKSYLKTTAQSIDWEVEKILIEFLKDVKKTNPRLTPFALGLINSCKGGKRIRGVLVKLGYEIATDPSDPRNDVIRIGAALEILHSAILIHDDIMDQSPIRRDQPSLYQALGGDHYGISQAISLGDIGLFLPIQIIAESSFPDQFKNKALSYLSQTIVNTGWGQILDVEVTQKGGEVSEDDINFINLYKTAKYTISGPLQIGAILSGADEKLIRGLGEFGENLGIAFQIKDDILDAEVKLEQAEEKLLAYANEARELIPKVTPDPTRRKLLKEMAEYMVERTK